MSGKASRPKRAIDGDRPAREGHRQGGRRVGHPGGAQAALAAPEARQQPEVERRGRRGRGWSRATRPPPVPVDARGATRPRSRDGAAVTRPMPSWPRSHACCASKGSRAEPRATAIHAEERGQGHEARARRRAPPGAPVPRRARAAPAGPPAARPGCPWAGRASRRRRRGPPGRAGPGCAASGGARARTPGRCPRCRPARRRPRWGAGRAPTSPGPPPRRRTRSALRPGSAASAPRKARFETTRAAMNGLSADRQSRRHDRRQQREEGEVGEDLAHLAGVVRVAVAGDVEVPGRVPAAEQARARAGRPGRPRAPARRRPGWRRRRAR